MKSEKYIPIIYVALAVLNISVHTICTSLLCLIYRKGNGSKTQQLYMLNLSLLELMKNIFFFVWNLTAAVGFELPATIMWLSYLCIFAVNISSMSLLTGDRLAASWLNVRYNNICTVFRVKVAILCTWVVCLVVVPSVFSVLYAVYGICVLDRIMKYTHKFAFPVIYILFFIFASITYAALFVFFVNSRNRSSSTHLSVLHLFRNSKFYVALLLISSFLVLSVLPQLVKSAMVLKILAFDETLKWTANVAFYLSDTADGVIYFLFYAPVRKLILKFLCMSETNL